MPSLADVATAREAADTHQQTLIAAALDAVAEGYSVVKVAHAAGVNRATIYKWQKREQP